MSKLKQFRKSKKLSQKEFAMAIGVSPSYYCKIEPEFQKPSFEFLCKLKRAYPSVSIDEMFFDEQKSH